MRPRSVSREKQLMGQKESQLIPNPLERSPRIQPSFELVERRCCLPIRSRMEHFQSPVNRYGHVAERRLNHPHLTDRFSLHLVVLGG
jgi:hypothetical protein